MVSGFFDQGFLPRTAVSGLVLAIAVYSVLAEVAQAQEQATEDRLVLYPLDIEAIIRYELNDLESSGGSNQDSRETELEAGVQGRGDDQRQPQVDMRRHPAGNGTRVRLVATLADTEPHQPQYQQYRNGTQRITQPGATVRRHGRFMHRVGDDRTGAQYQCPPQVTRTPVTQYRFMHQSLPA